MVRIELKTVYSHYPLMRIFKKFHPEPIVISSDDLAFALIIPVLCIRKGHRNYFSYRQYIIGHYKKAAAAVIFEVTLVKSIFRRIENIS